MEGFGYASPVTTPGTAQRPYHHGDLRRAVMREVLTVVRERGVSAVSVRDVARRAGATHTSVSHHFGDKAGLFTAVATEGYRLLADELRPVIDQDAGFLELGVAYVRFAVRNRSHFEVMFRTDLLRDDAPALLEARRATSDMLFGSATQIEGRASGEPDPRTVAGVAGWAMVHGIASLWLDGNLPPSLGDDPEEITRTVARLLGPPRTGA
jgi:AcrR family transcriptional regulator